MPSFGTSPSSAETFDSYGHNLPHHMRMTQQSSPQSRNRSVTVPMPPPLPSPGAGPAHHHLLLHGPPGQSAQSYYDQGNAGKLHGGGINRQNSSSSLASSGGAMRPSSSSQRFDPYAPASTSPRAATSGSMHSRRPSQPMIIPPGSSAGHSGSDYFPSPTYDVKPSLSPDLSHAHDLGQHTSYSYHPPATAPGSFADFGAFGSSAHQPVQSPGGAFGPSYAAWHHPSPSTAGRLNQPPPGREFGQLHHSPSHSHVSSHHSHSQSASGSQSLGVLMEAPSASSSNDGWGTPTHTHNQLPENPSGVNSFSQQVPQGWNGQYMGGDNDWRGQSTSVG
ncbi:hypothetical protein BD324DRAFT_158919 [Kockovaella imperatae]|uniref:Uncharacterized protein n=1 Tax=Kockovaella imperatae TaxID=4999 RepID=A0A1Y1UBT5_9TREE|nr:hypothetical protein BD324DRAFT_158919 [Kockovaella imperatae]ORX34545.1 hypothetical protein BD324DRAFT_158919 [Kockovaella imperatae]